MCARWYPSSTKLEATRVASFNCPTSTHLALEYISHTARASGVEYPCFTTEAEAVASKERSVIVKEEVTGLTTLWHKSNYKTLAGAKQAAQKIKIARNTAAMKQKYVSPRSSPFAIVAVASHARPAVSLVVVCRAIRRGEHAEAAQRCRAKRKK